MWSSFILDYLVYCLFGYSSVTVNVMKFCMKVPIQKLNDL